MKQNINRESVMAALHMVHTIERTSTNPNGLGRLAATEKVMREGPVLNHAEVDCLLTGLSVKRHELTIQWHPSLTAEQA